MKGFRKIAVLQAAGLLLSSGAVMLPAVPGGALAVCAAESDIEFDGIVIDRYSKECMITGFTDKLPADLVIPAEIDGLTVKWIGAGAFKGNKTLKSVSFPASLSTLNDECFKDCTALETVLFPEDDPGFYVSKDAFDGTPWLTAQKAKNPLVIASKTVIAGSGCSGELVIPEGVQAIEPGVFAGNTAITSVKLPSTLTRLNKEAFSGCTGLKSVRIPGSVDEVREKAFQNCTGLETLTCEQGVHRIGSFAFQGCTALKTLNLPDSLNDIWLYAFSKCNSLESVVLPQELRMVAAGAFTDCESLKEIICLSRYTYFAGEPGDPNSGVDNGISVSNTGQYSKKFRYDGVLRGYEDSLAQSYAGKFRLRFQSIGEAPKTGACGDRMTWALDEEGTLTIGGEGDMTSYEPPQKEYGKDDFTDASYVRVPPWYHLRGSIKKVVIGQYVHTVSTAAMRELENLESVVVLNPDCELSYSKSAISNGTKADGSYYYDGTISSYTGSWAQKVADYLQIPFIALDGPDTTTEPVTTTALTTTASSATTKAVTTTVSSTTTKAVTTTVSSATTKPVTTTVTTTTAPAEQYQTGDVNGDGTVSIEDAQLVLKDYTEGVSGKASQLSEAQKRAANVDGSSGISVEDAQLILKYYTEKYVAGKNVTWESILKK